MKLRLTTGQGGIVETKVKKKYQFHFPVNEQYLEIDRDFVWTRMGRYGYAVAPYDDSVTLQEICTNYDERIIWDSAADRYTILPNFFDFQLYVNGRKLFNKYVNFRVIPTIQHGMELPCPYYLPKGSKLFVEFPWVGSYLATLPRQLTGLTDTEAFEQRNISLEIDGYEVEEIKRDDVEAICRPHIYAVGGYWGMYEAGFTPPTYPLGVSGGAYKTGFIPDIERVTGITWPRVNDNKYPLADQVLKLNSGNICPIVYENDCLITKIWRYDWEWYDLDFPVPFDAPTNSIEVGIWDEPYQWPYKPTMSIGNNGVIGDNIALDLIYKAPNYHWRLGGLTGPINLNNLIMYSRVQYKDFKQRIHNVDRNIQEILSSHHIGLPHSVTNTKVMRRRRSDVDNWNIKINYDEFVAHNGLETGNLCSLGVVIQGVKFFYAKRLILMGVKEFITTVNK